MRELRPTKGKFRGVQFILYDKEYDYIINFCNKVKEENKGCDNICSMADSVISSVSNYSYFDPENREVHVRLGYEELSYLLFLFTTLQIDENVGAVLFDEKIAEMGCRIWGHC